ncbi:MAG TPA: four helix bundle protein [Chitinophagaceae bacterium]|nr:four helix bundle protein [Chitinophagaceae bacterium]
MSEEKKYDLEQRTESFSLAVRDFCTALKKDVVNVEYIKQLVRSAGSVGANYIEANDNLGENDLKMRIRICRKESKESVYWLKHVLTYEDSELETKRLELKQEANELTLIFAAILRKLNK